MELHERIALIIKENKLKQKELAKIIGVTESYISALLNKRNINPSQSFANLLEEKLGYSARWVLNDEEPKLKQASKNKTLSDIHKKAIIRIEKMNDEQIKAVLAFVNSLEEIEESFSNDHEISSEKEKEIQKEGEAYMNELRLEANMKTQEALKKPIDLNIG